MYLYSELKQTYFEMLKGQPITYKEFDFIGSRGSGKTHNSMDYVIKAFFMPKKNIIYVFRENQSDLDNFKAELFPKLEELNFIVKNGIGGNYNAKLNMVSNGYNKIIFKALNAEKMDVNKGKGAGLPIWKDADNIIAFFEECTQIDEDLVNITIQGLRGNKNTNIIKIFCANPWSPLNWYVKKCNNLLKENLNELVANGYQKYVGVDSKGSNVVMVRNNIYTNEYLQEDLKRELESYKNIDYNMWLICCIGMSGSLGELIYATNMNKMKPVDYEHINDNNGGWFQGGLDWGDGSSIGASPTTAHFGKIHLVLGVDIVDEITIWNNQGVKLETNEQIDKIIEFYKKCLLTYGKPFKVFVDNASLSDFYQMFNARLHLHGLDTSLIEFLPTPKVPIQMRIDVINVMISSGLYRVDKDKCKDLINALNNAHWVENKSPREGVVRVRNHDETHWINSGAEYILANTMYDFKTKWNTIFEKIKY